MEPTRVPGASSSHLVLIPSYNSGHLLVETVESALQVWRPVWVILDGSTDDSKRLLQPFVSAAKIQVLALPENRGKGAAVLAGLNAALDAGFSHALIMDSDGQHPADYVPELMTTSMHHPSAMVLGVPQFGPDAPLARKYGRKIGNWWTKLETSWGGIEDSLFGFRVYPIKPAVQTMLETRGGRGYDFDTQLVVRLYWNGVRPLSINVPVRYLSKAEGGVSHFHYVRDNLLLIKTHVALLFGMVSRLLGLRWKK